MFCQVGDERPLEGEAPSGMEGALAQVDWVRLRSVRRTRFSARSGPSAEPAGHAYGLLRSRSLLPNRHPLRAGKLPPSGDRILLWGSIRSEGTVY